MSLPRFGHPPMAPQLPSWSPGPERRVPMAVPSQGRPGWADQLVPSGQGPAGEGVQFSLYDADELTAVLQRAFASGVAFRTRPSPIDAVPYRGRVLGAGFFARVVIAPPTAPGDAEGTVAAAALANAEGAVSGQAVNVLTPADVDSWVTVLSYEVPSTQALVVKGVGAWGHDLPAQREAIKWKVSGAGGVLVAEDELAMIGSLSDPAEVYGVFREGQTLVVEARNLDTRAPSLVEVRIFGWTFSAAGNEDTLASLLDSKG